MKAITESGKTITIDDKFEIKRGGEGKILTIPELPNQVAKIYLNKNYQHMSKAQKNALSVLDSSLFVKPLELIYDKKNSSDILGFTMEYLNPDFVPLAAFFNKNFCLSQNIDHTFKFNLSMKLIKGIESAHANQVIVGDLSGLNILVNLSCEVRFLDVDSYETNVHTHWGVLFDEIRDYYYQGKVSKNSDYFALAILIFNLMTHLHPYKGVHKRIKSVAERMISKIPVFAQDPDLIIPKCYEPIQEMLWQAQFEDIFLNGKRFLLDLGTKAATAPKLQAQPITVLQSALKIKEIYKPEKSEIIRQVHFNQQLGFVRTDSKLMLFDASNLGYTILKHSFDWQEITKLGSKPHIFIGEQNLFVLTSDSLYFYQSSIGFLKISNLAFSANRQFFQIGNILVILDGDFMRYLHLDQVIKDQIFVEQIPVFTQGFDVFNGLIQNTGGVQYIFYHSGKNISTLKAKVDLQAVRIVGDVGIAVYEEKLNSEISLKYEYFDIQSLQMILSGEKLGHFKNFAYRSQGGIIFEAADDKLLIRKKGTFQILQESDCSLLSTETSLFSTQAGIVAFEKDFCCLLNSN